MRGSVPRRRWRCRNPGGHCGSQATPISLLAVKDDVVGVAILLLVVVGLKRDARLDGEGFEFAREHAVFAFRELPMMSALFFITSPLLWRPAPHACRGRARH